MALVALAALVALVYVTDASLPHLVRGAEDSPRRVTDLVNISSNAGRTARPGNAVYSFTKAGLISLSDSLRQELLGQRVRVSVVEPGLVDTELVPTCGRRYSRSPGNSSSRSSRCVRRTSPTR